MNISHKCHFHPANLIAKFCSNKQCTLPLCYECEPIHFQQHASRQSQPKLLRFNQAYFHAMNQIEEFLDVQRQYLKEVENKVKNDKQTVLQWIDQYYGQVNKTIDTTKAQAKQMEQKLAKLKKGSIKTLIFFYSGDIVFPNYQIQFELLSNKIQTLTDPKTELPKSQPKRNQILPIAEEKSQPFDDRRYVHSYAQQITQEQTEKNKIIREAPKPPSQNIFNNIEDIKKDKYRQKSTRKSIFDQYDKNSKTSNEPSGVNTSLTNAPPQHINFDIKYNYTRQTEIENPRDSQNFNDPSPKFNQEMNNRQIFAREKHIFIEEEQPISFQQRYANKPFEPQRQYQQFKIQKNEQQPRQLTEENPHQQIKKQIQKENNTKLMKPSDLQIEGQISKKNTTPNNASNNNLINQRNRAVSQTNLTDRQFRKNGYECDMKKQVLPPEQIRKMLQKRIQERHRILSIKKADNNYQPNQYEEKVPARKMWETKDSIINQIYGQTKY